ncbi:MAG: tandem-95 repeat protein [Bacteroidales bacterium]|nr:tandem-95 repeat protein [Bacteroidales bacterium]
MSSSDSLALPSCSDITFACLFWGGHAVTSTPNWTLRNRVKIKANNDAYVDVTADSVGYWDQQIYFKPYYCYKDITSIVKKYGVNTKWTVANVVGQTGEINRFSGWNMVIVYKNEEQLLRQLTVFNSVAIIEKNTQSDIKLTGFKTPTQGPVSFEMGVFAYDGDRPNSGDQLLLKGGKSSSFENVSDNINDANNVFNSTISRYGKLTPYRIPNYNNNFSIDADIFSPDNTSFKYIANGDTTLTMRLTTLQDVYLTQAVSLVVDANIPDNRLGMRVKDLNGGFVEPGDTLEYTLTGSNVGTDHSVDTYISNVIEKKAVYVPNSTRITYGPNAGPKTDAANDDQADFDVLTNTLKVRIGRGSTGVIGGEVDNSLNGSDSTQIKFKVTVAVSGSTDCAELMCDNIVDNHAFIHGKGKDSGLEFVSDQVPQFFDNSTCSVGDISNKTSVIVYTSCPGQKATLIGSQCAGSNLELSGPIDANAIYEWSGPNKFASTLRNPIISKAKKSDSGDYVLKMINTVTNCHSYFIIQLKVNDGSIANAGQNQSICADSTNLQGNSPETGLGLWTVVTGGDSNVIIDNTASPTTKVKFKASGIYKLEWRLPDSGCTNIPDTVTIRVGLDCKPTVDNEHHILNSGETATGDLTNVGDTSTDGKPLVVNINPVVTPKNGGITINPDGTYIYTPTPNFVGKDTIVVNICDQQTPPKCADDTIFIQVLAPLTLDNEYHNIKPTEVAAGDLTNSGDVSFDSTFKVNTTPTVPPRNGQITIATDGTYTYTPTSGFIGKDTVIVTICDNQIPSVCGKDTIFITVSNVVVPLVIDNEHQTINECAIATGDLTDTGDSSAGNNFVIAPTKYATKLGTIDISSNGNYTFTSTCGKVGKDTIIVNICDTQTPKLCKNDTIFITVLPLNSTPLAIDDNETSLTGKLGENDVQSQDGPNIWTKLTDPIDDKGIPTGTIVVDEDGTFTYTPPAPDFTGIVTFTYRITDKDGDTSDATVTITVLPLFIPEGFSPNGDGVHDKFVIKGIESYPKNIFSIFNRWGNKVYQASPYLNNWDGTNTEGMSVGGNVLPVGAYFYILDLGTGQKAIKGNIYLSR